MTLKIWDAFLCEGNKVLIRWCIAIYLHHEERLLRTKDQAQVMQILKHRVIEAKVKLFEKKNLSKIFKHQKTQKFIRKLTEKEKYSRIKKCFREKNSKI